MNIWHQYIPLFTILPLHFHTFFSAVTTLPPCYYCDKNSLTPSSNTLRYECERFDCFYTSTNHLQERSWSKQEIKTELNLKQLTPNCGSGTDCSCLSDIKSSRKDTDCLTVQQVKGSPTQTKLQVHFRRRYERNNFSTVDHEAPSPWAINPDRKIFRQLELTSRPCLLVAVFWNNTQQNNKADSPRVLISKPCLFLCLHCKHQAAALTVGLKPDSVNMTRSETKL